VNLPGGCRTHIQKTLKKKDFFSLVLSGGNTPKKLFQLLSSRKYRTKIEWERIHLFWGDERVVDFSDERNNAKMGFRNLLSIVPVIKDQVHIINTSMDPVYRGGRI
jgi:6-phosphogluconolactonase